MTTRKTNKPKASRQTRKNAATGIKAAYWESTGKRPRSLKQACEYWGIAKP